MLVQLQEYNGQSEKEERTSELKPWKQIKEVEFAVYDVEGRRMAIRYFLQSEYLIQLEVREFRDLLPLKVPDRTSYFSF